MQKGFGQSEPKMIEYAWSTFRPEDETLRAARLESERRGLPEIQVGAFDALHLEVLVRLSGARRAVEIGTLGGYSGIAIVRGMGAAGHLHTFELDPHHAETARLAFEAARVSDRVRIHVGPAIDNLATIEREGPFDLVFIDADKVSYPKYLEWATNHLRVGGTVIADNTFGWNRIADRDTDSSPEGRSLRALHLFNETVATGGRYRATILPTAEGLTVAVKLR